MVTLACTSTLGPQHHKQLAIPHPGEHIPAAWAALGSGADHHVTWEQVITFRQVILDPGYLDLEHEQKWEVWGPVGHIDWAQCSLHTVQMNVMQES